MASNEGDLTKTTEHAAYCGMANHAVSDKNHFLGGFNPCDNSKGTTVTCPDGGCTGSVG